MSDSPRVLVAARTTSKFDCPREKSPYVRVPPPAALPYPKVPGPRSAPSFQSLACFGGGPVVRLNHLMFSSFGDVFPAFFTKSTVVAVYLDSPSSGAGPARNLLAPPTPVADTPVHRYRSGNLPRPNTGKSDKSTILRNCHAFSIGRYGRKLKRVIDHAAGAGGGRRKCLR